MADPRSSWPERTQLRDRYRELVRRAAEGDPSDEAILYAASELGRECIQAQLGPHEVSEMHFSVSAELLSRVRPVTNLERGLTNILLEILVVYGKSHREVQTLVSELRKRFVELDQAQGELRRTHDYVGRVVATLRDCLLVWDSEGTLTDVNEATASLLGWERPRLMGKHVSELFFGAGREFFEGKAFRKMMAGDGVQSRDLVFRTRDGRDIPVSFSASAMRGAEGEIEGGVGTARDLSDIERLVDELERSERELKARTAQLIQSEKLSALGELSATVIHEITQPLNAVMLICEDVQRDQRRDRLDPASLDESLGEMMEEIRNVAKIVDQLRVFSRRTAGTRRVDFEIAGIVERALRLYGPQLAYSGIVIETTVEPDLSVRGDPTQLEQVLRNLLTNARDAIMETASAGRVTISARRDLASGDVVLEVSDDGAGIDPKMIKRIFEPFYTSKDPDRGTGLGLSVAQEIVINHSGRIEVESVPEGGATFRVWLPVEDVSDRRSS